MALTVILAGVALLLSISAFSIVVHRNTAGRVVVYGASLIISVVGLLVATGALLGQGSTEVLTLPIGLPWLGAHFRLDSLSAFFLAVVNLGGAAASLYALGYGKHEHAPQRVLPFYPLFLAGMSLVVIADDAFTFLFSWEFMSLSSWALVMAHDQIRENVRAGYIYLVMASFGTLALLLAFGLLAGPSGDYAFDVIRETHPSATLGALVLILVLIGTGSKAGLVPLHAWLPLAHPAAPSHVSGLLSGVMTKVAVYAFVRIAFDLLGQPEWWWSMLVLALAGITCVMGVLYALMQHDLKRLLAYHTVENIGIIFIGLGLALGFQTFGFSWAAALAFTAALLHVLNHSLFKNLLFLGAGAVLGATGERNMEHLGGLIHKMPLTAFTFLIGCVAISALPPLNGFVSEWLTFQAILQSPQLSSWGLKFLIPAVGALLALSAALAAACFVKAFGITFLGRPRSEVAKKAHEADRFSLAAMFALAVLCLIAGILPGFFIDALGTVAKAMVGDSMPLQRDVPFLSIVPIAEARSSYNGLLVFLFMLLSASAAAFAIHRLASDRLRRGPAWDCGYPDPSPQTQYTASSFAQPIRRVFGTLIFRASETVEMPPPGDARPARIAVRLSDVIWDTLYAPIGVAVDYVAGRLNRMQSLSIQHYLSFVFVALVGLLLVLAIWP
ncbi:MAG TPA: hydrogenase 4 subunit B [Methyloceanibacter sp.]|jgi:formate hydrogenlyase subunit 3/multisubunit Na+/H+ antiporter MnhD subunit|nr:hydrogenase 4 subunit B [Methyloceanibacter sp.]